MKSCVCSNANYFIKNGMNRHQAFVLAWKHRKLIDKTITIEYGDYENFVTCKIYSVSYRDKSKDFIVCALSKYGLDIEFCCCPKELLAL